MPEVGDIRFDAETKEGWVWSGEKWLNVWTGENVEKPKSSFEMTADTFREFGKAMREMGAASRKAVAGMLSLAMAPHRGGWIESVGWVCERCGAESMDLDLLRELGCSDE